VLDRPVASLESSASLGTRARAGWSSRYRSPSPQGGGGPSGARLELIPSLEHTSGLGGIPVQTQGDRNFRSQLCVGLF